SENNRNHAPQPYQLRFHHIHRCWAVSASTGDASPAPMRFFAYEDPKQNTLEQIKMVRSHPWIAKDIPLRGFIFDVDTGLLGEVTLPQTTEKKPHATSEA